MRAISWSAAEYIDYPKSPLERSTRGPRLFATKQEYKVALFEDLMLIGTCFGVTIKADCLAQIGSFDCSLRVVEDAEMFLRISARGYVPQVLEGIHMTLHNHTSDRLTRIRMHPARISECHQMIACYETFITGFLSLRRELDRRIDSLQNELELELIQ